MSNLGCLEPDSASCPPGFRPWEGPIHLFTGSVGPGLVLGSPSSIPSPSRAGLQCLLRPLPRPQPLTSSRQCPPAFHSCSVTLSNTLLCVCHPTYITCCRCPFGVSVPLVLAFPCPRSLPKTSATLCPRPEVLGNQGSPSTFGQ